MTKPDRKQIQQYIKSGYPLIRLHGYGETDKNGNELGKRPMDKDWANIAPLSKDDALVHVATGKNLGVQLRDTDLIIDADPRNYPAGDNPLKRLGNDIGIDLEEYVTVITGGGGCHIYLRKDPEAKIKLKHEKYPGIDFKTKGGQIVAAGSVHPSGVLYEFDPTGIGLDNVPRVPEALIALLSGSPKNKPVENTHSGGVLTPERLEEALSALDAEDFRDYPEWLDLMMACHHATGGKGGEVFSTWSATDPEFADREKETLENWKKLKVDGNMSGKITYKTLLKILRDNGHTDLASSLSLQIDYSDVSTENGDESSPAEKKVKELALLPELEYETRREDIAKEMGIRISVLDKLVDKARPAPTNSKQNHILFPDVIPYPSPVDGSELLDEIYDTVRQFIICDSEVARTVALWVAFTWLIERFQVAPLAVITAPEKRCGKSQLLSLIGRLCYRPLIASNISSAAIFRVVEAYSPTLLIDEADTFLRENEEARGIVNSGHTRQGAFVLRTTGDEHEPKSFSTWGAKAICGIGRLSDTLMDRAVIFELRRKLPSESVERLRHADPSTFNRLSSKLARYAQDAGEKIQQARPELPDALNDRAQDNWEPLIAIADHAGGQWPKLARKAALKLSSNENDAGSLSLELLSDIKNILRAKPSKHIKTEDLMASLLHDDDTRPWATFHRGGNMSPRQLADMLKSFGIKPIAFRRGSGTFRGYEASAFEDVFARYLPPAPEDDA